MSVGRITVLPALSCLLLIASASLAIVDASGEPAHRVTAISEPADPGVLGLYAPVRIGDLIYFVGGDSVSSGLYVTDGSPGRLRQLKHLTAQRPVDLRGATFFLATQGGEAGLWATDGTPQGTRQVRQLGTSAGFLNASGGLLYFLGEGSRLWRSDGTAFGTFPLPVIGTSGIDVAEFAELGGEVFFFGRAAEADEIGLWKTRGSAQSTRLVHDLGTLNPGSHFHRFAYGMAIVGDRLLFHAFEPDFQYRLWSSDGTPTGTIALRDYFGESGVVCPDYCFPAGPSRIVSDGALGLFFANDGAHGREPWRTDGTSMGTRLVKDIAVGEASSIWAGSFSEPAALSSGGAAFHAFAADDGVHGMEVWKTNGTETGTTLLADLVPGPDSSYPYYFVASGGAVFFHAGQSLYRSDGTATGTQNFGGLDGFAFTLGDDLAITTSIGLFLSDGTNLLLVDDLRRPRGLDPQSLTAGTGRIFFTDSSGGSLWVSDGSPQGTNFLGRYGIIDALTSVGSGVFYAPLDGVVGTEPWTSDGTPEGTRLVSDIFDRGSSLPSQFTRVGRQVFFTATDESHGEELWVTDGTNSGTRMVRDLVEGPGGSFPRNLVAFRGSLYFTPTMTGGLWKSDGTVAGTVPISDVGCSQLIAGTDSLFFVGTDGPHGEELWRSDGTAEGTAIVADIAPGIADTSIESLVVAGPHVFLTARVAGVHELWSSDGTLSGTLRLPSGDYVQSMVPSGNQVFFVSPDEEHGAELWKSDGTPEGTRLIRDIQPGPASSDPSSLTSVGTALLFAAEDPEHGNELWVSDGTEEGTTLLQDISPGPASSSPGNFTLVNRSVFFAASDEEAGRQIWAMPASILGHRSPRSLPPTRIVDPRE